MTSVELEFPEDDQLRSLAGDWARPTLTRLRAEDRAEGQREVHGQLARSTPTAELSRIFKAPPVPAQNRRREGPR